MTASAITTNYHSRFANVVSSVHGNTDETLQQLSATKPVLIVFLRHAGCTFCREALADLQQRRAAIEAQGAWLALVHMISDDAAGEFFRQYQLDDVPRFSDPEKVLYQAFELKRGSLWQLLGASVWARGIKAFIAGHGIGRVQGDPFQLPGAFLLDNGKIVHAYHSSDSAGRPDYVAMCRIS